MLQHKYLYGGLAAGLLLSIPFAASAKITVNSVSPHGTALNTNQITSVTTQAKPTSSPPTSDPEPPATPNSSEFQLTTISMIWEPVDNPDVIDCRVKTWTPWGWMCWPG
jgi:hypothetical protein